MNQPLTYRSRSTAFSLVELLVVIAIVGILSSLVLNFLSKSRGSAQSIACLANLRQLASASFAYGADNDNALVPIAGGTISGDAVTWRKLLVPYLGEDKVGKVFRCPGDTTARYQEVKSDNYIRPTSYGINNATSLHQYLAVTPASQKLSAVRKPTETIFIADIGVVENVGSAPEQWKQKPSSGSYGYANFPNHWSWAAGNNWNVFPRHNARANVVFYDGHSESVNVSASLVPFPPGHEKCLYDN